MAIPRGCVCGHSKSSHAKRRDHCTAYDCKCEKYEPKAPDEKRTPAESSSS